MAQVTNGSITSGEYSGRSITFNWSRASYNVETNQTTINWSLVGSGGATYWVQSGNFKVIIDGVQVFFSATRINLSNGTVVATGSYTFTHNNEGNKSFSAYAEAGVNTIAVSVSTSGTWELPTIPRYTTSVQTLVSKTETSITMSWRADNTVDYIWYSKDNGSTWIGIDVPDGTSGTYVISKLTANTSYNIKTRVRRKDSQLTTDSTALAVTTYNYPYAMSVPNFIVGEDLILTLYNPLNRECTVYITPNNGQDLGGVTTNTTSTKVSDFKTNDVINGLYSASPNNNTNTYNVKVIFESSTIISTTSGTYTITDSNPIFTNFTYNDINPITIALTGNDQYVINGYSNIKATISIENKAIAKNYATMDKYRLVIGNKQVDVDYDDLASVELVINKVTNNVITVYAIDSRGNSTSKQISVSNFIDYNSPYFSQPAPTIKRVGGIGSSVILDFNTTYFNNSFGVSNNALNVTYKYKKTSDVDYIIGVTNLILVDESNGIMSFSGEISGDLETEGFDPSYSYNIQLYATDKLSTTIYSNFILGTGIPNLAMHRNGISINKPYDPSLGGSLQVKDNVNIDGSINAKEVYQNGIKLGGTESVPIGTIIDYPGDTAPNGWLLMGPDYSRTAYPELFAVIGTKFGAGDGSTTFGTDAKGRVFVGLDTSQTEFNQLGKKGGHKLLQAHEHSIEPYGGKGGYGSAGHTGIIAQTGGTTYNSYYAKSTGGGDSQNLQPYIVTNRIIKAFNVATTTPSSTVVNNLTTPSPTDSLSANMGVELLKLINKSVITVVQNDNYSASIGNYGGYYLTISPTAREINHDKFQVVSGLGGGIKILKKCKLVLSALVTFVWDSGASGEYSAILRRNRGGTITEVARSYTNKPATQLAHITIPDFIIEDAEVNDIYVLYVSSSTAVTMKIYGSTTSLITYMTAKEY